MKETRTCKEPNARWIQKLIFIIFWIPATLLIEYSMLNNVPLYYEKNQIGEIFGACIGFMLCVIGQYLCVVAIVELKTVASIIKLTEDRVIGYSRFGKHHWEMRYEDINTITPKQNGWALILKDKEDNKLMVSIFAHPFGDCMETIQKKAVNAIKIDFGRHKDNKRIWKMS